MNRYVKSVFLSLIIVSCLISCTKGNVKSKYINYQGHKIYYEVRGNSSKTIVFIHGWTSSIQSWKYQLDSFNKYKVIAIDLPGNGKSSKNEKTSYTMELFADSVKFVLDKEKVKNAFLIGHSMGFAVIDVISIKYPELCLGICSMDGTHFEFPEDTKEQENWIQYNREFANSMEKESGRRNFINMLFLPDTPKILKEEVLQISKKVPLSIARSMINGVEKDQKFWTKKKIAIPCLAIYSPVYQLPPNYKEELKKTYLQLEYHEIQGVSHFLMMETPYKINQIIYDFLNKVYNR